MSNLSNVSESDKIENRMEEIPEVPMMMDKDWTKQIQILNDQVETFKDENMSLESLVNVLKKENQSLIEQNKDL